jgi:hypothetical protein
MSLIFQIDGFIYRFKSPFHKAAKVTTRKKTAFYKINFKKE